MHAKHAIYTDRYKPRNLTRQNTRKKTPLQLIIYVVINLFLIGIGYFVFKNSFIDRIIFHTGGGHGYIATLICFLINILIIMLLSNSKKIRVIVSKLYLSWICIYIFSSFLLTSTMFTLNHYISLKTTYIKYEIFPASFPEMYSDNEFYNHFTYDFNGVAHDGKISKELCNSNESILVKQSTGLFGIEVDRYEYKPIKE